jgi:hypothetical protein
MQTKYRVLAGSLVGAVAIHAAFIACGGGGGTAGGPAPDGGLFDALLDVLATAMDGETKDAKANGDSGGPAPAATRTITADTDQAQLRRFDIPAMNGPSWPGVTIIDGPFVVTSASTGATTLNAWAVAKGSPCGTYTLDVSDLPGRRILVGPTTVFPAPTHVFVGPTETLCAVNLNTSGTPVVNINMSAGTISGFVPY